MRELEGGRYQSNLTITLSTTRPAIEYECGWNFLRILFLPERKGCVRKEDKIEGKVYDHNTSLYVCEHNHSVLVQDHSNDCKSLQICVQKR